MSEHTIYKSFYGHWCIYFVDDGMQVMRLREWFFTRPLRQTLPMLVKHSIYSFLKGDA